MRLLLLVALLAAATGGCLAAPSLLELLRGLHGIAVLDRELDVIRALAFGDDCAQLGPRLSALTDALEKLSDAAPLFDLLSDQLITLARERINALEDMLLPTGVSDCVRNVVAQAMEKLDRPKNGES